MKYYLQNRIRNLDMSVRSASSPSFLPSLRSCNIGFFIITCKSLTQEIKFQRRRPWFNRILCKPIIFPRFLFIKYTFKVRYRVSPEIKAKRREIRRCLERSLNAPLASSSTQQNSSHDQRSVSDSPNGEQQPGSRPPLAHVDVVVR